MEPAIPVLLVAYAVSFAAGLLMHPPSEQWLPNAFQAGGDMHRLTPLVWVFAAVMAPAIVAVALAWKAFSWISSLVQRQQRAKTSRENGEDSLEAGCNFEDSLLSDSDIPPLYEDYEFSIKTSSSSPSPSIY